MKPPLKVRIDAAWHALRGWSVIHGVDVEHGEVTVKFGNLLLTNSELKENQIWTRGPVGITGNGKFTHNAGYGTLTPQAMARQASDENR